MPEFTHLVIGLSLLGGIPLLLWAILFALGALLREGAKKTERASMVGVGILLAGIGIPLLKVAKYLLEG